jgi:hypothetical protein
MKIVLSFIHISLLLIISFYVSAFSLQQKVGIQTISKANTTNLAANANPASNAQYYVKGIETKAPTDSIVKQRDTSFRQIDTRYSAAFGRLKSQAASIKQYAKVNNYSVDYCFLVDMSLPSGKKRFFVYNLKKDSIENSALVSHGFGSYKPDCDDILVFSNAPNSFKTSLGKYKVGTSYNGTYGLAYKLYGLDTSNSRALERAIVLHSDKHIPETETYPFRIFQSAGCPAVSPIFLPLIGNYIKATKKPILLWIYN